MKKSLLAIAMIHSLCGAAFAADALQYDIRVVRTEGGTVKEIQQVSMAAEMGHEVPFMNGRTDSYVADVSRQSDGSLSLTPATITSGFVATVKPLAINKETGSIDTQVAIALTELAGFETKVINGVEVQQPTIRNRLSARHNAHTTDSGSHTVALARGATPTKVAEGDNGIEVFISLK